MINININNLLCLIILFLLIIYYIYHCKIENFENSNTATILEDPLFKDIIIFNNDENPYEKGQKIGLTKCLDECNGTCVEFGISGIAYCFPKQ